MMRMPIWYAGLERTFFCQTKCHGRSLVSDAILVILLLKTVVKFMPWTRVEGNFCIGIEFLWKSIEMRIHVFVCYFNRWTILKQILQILLKVKVVFKFSKNHNPRYIKKIFQFLKISAEDRIGQQYRLQLLRCEYWNVHK